MSYSVSCEQMVYTSAEIDGVRGFQIVARSKAITDQELAQVRKFIFPLGLTPGVPFDQSRCVQILPTGRISISLVKNIGIGYDGREGTLYNHTLIISPSDYSHAGTDPEPFWNALEQMIDPLVRGSLSPVIVDVDLPPRSPFERISSLDQTRLYLAILAMLTSVSNPNKRIVLVGQSLGQSHLLPRDLLMLLPAPLRFISFSTYVVEPEQEAPAFRLMLSPRLNSVVPQGDTWQLVDLDHGTISPPIHALTSLAHGLAHAVLTRDYDYPSQVQAVLEKLEAQALDLHPRESLEYVDQKIRLNETKDFKLSAKIHLEAAMNLVVPREVRLYHFENSREDALKAGDDSVLLQASKELLSQTTLDDRSFLELLSDTWMKMLQISPVNRLPIVANDLIVINSRVQSDASLLVYRHLLKSAGLRREQSEVVGKVAALVPVRNAIISELVSDKQNLGSLVLPLVRLGDEAGAVSLITISAKTLIENSGMDTYLDFARLVTSNDVLSTLSPDGVERATNDILKVLEEHLPSKKPLLKLGRSDKNSRAELSLVQKFQDRLVFPLLDFLDDRLSKDKAFKNAWRRVLEFYIRTLDNLKSEG